MNFLSVVNIIANLTICLGITGFFVLLFGNHNSIVHKWPVLQHWTLKASLVSIIATSAWNAMNTIYFDMIPRHGMVIESVNTPVGEILLNVGLAALFVWIVYFHYFHFMKAAPAKIKAGARKKTAKKKTRAKKPA